MVTEREPQKRSMRISAHGAVFGVFAMIDGVRQIDDPPHGELRLTCVAPDGNEQPLSGPGGDLDELHARRARQVPIAQPAAVPHGRACAPGLDGLMQGAPRQRL